MEMHGGGGAIVSRSRSSLTVKKRAGATATTVWPRGINRNVSGVSHSSPPRRVACENNVQLVSYKRGASEQPGGAEGEDTDGDDEQKRCKFTGKQRLAKT